MKTLLFITLLLAGVVPSGTIQARLGETPQGCIELYGKPWRVDKEHDQMFFKMAELVIMAQFREGICTLVTFVKAENEAEDRALEMSEAEINALMDANSGGTEWKELPSLNGNKSWKTIDDKIVANYSRSKRFLGIMTRAELKRPKDKPPSREGKTEGGTNGERKAPQMQNTGFEEAIKKDINTIHIALTVYEGTVGRPPTTEQGLDALVTAPRKPPVPDRWRACLEEVPLDPWKHPYHYRRPALKSNRQYDIWSAGPDGVDGTEDDIGN